MLLLIPPLLFMLGDHAIAVTICVQGVIVGIYRLMSLDMCDTCVYSLSADHADVTGLSAMALLGISIRFVTADVT